MLRIPRHSMKKVGSVTGSSHPFVVLAAILFLSSSSAATAQDPDEELRMRAQLGEADAIRTLLERNALIDVDSRGEGGWTALMYAAKAGSDEVVLLLVDAGADVHLKNDGKETALHLAAKYGRTKTLRILLAAGADLSARDAEGRTPLYRAIENRHGDVIEVLREKAQAMVDEGQSPPPGTEEDEADTIPPRIVESTPAEYTHSARDKRIEGTVVLMVLVRRDGTIGGASVSKGLEESLDQAALQTVRKWKFEPATRSGQPVDALLEISIDFTLPEKR